MGARHSLYESSGPMNYVKLSLEDHTRVKQLWSEIESNPQFYGTAFFSSLVEVYPQYIKFFTLEQYRPLHLDVRTTSKFTVIMEAMGFLFLDFYSKPKQLDRLVGYIAMVHKDMKLEKQDMFNFGYHLLGFMSETFPTKMTIPVREVLSKFLVSILLEVSRKMDYYRNCEAARLGIEAPSTRLPCGECSFFGDQLIFGHTKAYWLDYKQQWDTRMSNWLMESAKSIQATIGSSTDDEDTSTHKMKTSDEAPDAADQPAQRRSSSMMSHQSRKNVRTHSSKLTLTNLTRKLESDGESPSGKHGPEADKRENIHEEEQEDGSPRSPQKRMTARERHRARTLAREVTNPTYDGAVLRKRVRSSRMNLASQSRHQGKGSEPSDGGSSGHSGRTARNRRRESTHFH